ncbi:MAG: NAD-dependent epimerase/dehydratase family protein [Candidatus Zixiibacteriota bacterium]|nr:MAG: NAD-dependent epimerase/dehydratase family protein [candidate division Zixibacteria bacterium]
MIPIDFTDKTVLVTGGAGFVGSNVVSRIVRTGGRVIVLDDLFTGSLDNIDSDIPYEFVEGSVSDYELVRGLMARSDFVAHLAARNIIISTRNPIEDYRSNIGGTLNILMAARETKPNRIVYTSSASIYGNPRILPIMEDETPLTFSPYSVSKLAGENYCYAFYETFYVPAAVVRYSNIFGPKQNPANPYCGVISKFIRAIDRGETPQIHGDGHQTRDFTYVDDAVDATLSALLSPRAEGMVFNIGTGTETSILDIVRTLSEIFGRELVCEHIDRRDIDNIRRRVLNIERIRTRLRWQPQVTFREGLRRTVEWYRTIKPEAG